MSNSRPYRGVIAENHIRRLKSQVQSEHNKNLKGRPKKTLEASGNYFDDYDDNDSLNESHAIRSRLCEQTLSKKGGGSVVSVSKAKLLEASLLSLETLGRQRYSGAPNGDSEYPQGNYYMKIEYLYFCMRKMSIRDGSDFHIADQLSYCDIGLLVQLLILIEIILPT